MQQTYRVRRYIVVVVALIGVAIAMATTPDMYQQVQPQASTGTARPSGAAAQALAKLPVKGRAAKTGYTRTQFGDGWQIKAGCDTRNIILNRDMTNVAITQGCKVQSGTLQDPYTATTIQFARGADTSDDVQIDHVVALSDAWQKGAQQLTAEQRVSLANDPLELLAVDGSANQEKSDGDAATWLPPNKSFRCQYVARQIAVKTAYMLWVTQAESEAMTRVLSQCPGQPLPNS